MEYISKMKGDLMMKTLRELLDNRDKFIQTDSDDEMFNGLDDFFVIYMYMTQDDIPINKSDMTCRHILNSLHNKRLIRDHDKLKESSVNNE